MATLVSIVAIALLSVAACETTAPALRPEAPFAPAAGLPSAGDEPGIFVNGERVDGHDARLVLAELRLATDHDDIESSDVIKGSAAIGLYGADASSGIVRINLKSSGGGPATVVDVIHKTLTPLRQVAPGVAAETGSITGRVIDAQSSQPIPAAQVFIAALDQTGIRPRFGVLSRENGTYILENVPVGTHAVTVQRIGYRTVTVDVTVAVGQTTARDFRVTPRE